MKINTFMVCYDICDPKRLRKVHRVMKGYGIPIQYSIFKCTLSPTNYQRMITRVEKEMDLCEDSVMIVDLGPDDGLWKRRVKLIGEKKELNEDEQGYIF